MTQDTAQLPLDERGLEAATDRLLNIRRQDIESGSLMRFREVAAEIIRAYLQTAAADVSGLVEEIHEAEWWQRGDENGQVTVSIAPERVAEAYQTLSASNAALEAENERLREAWDWAIAEIKGHTRYENDSQFENALGVAGATLARSGLRGATPAANFRAPVDDDELRQWAELRADDAGRLARELAWYRGIALSAPKGGQDHG